jgi:hypothetical protein
MWRLVKNEVRRAFCNKMMLGVLAVGAVLAVWEMLMYAVPMQPYLYEERDMLKGGMIPSLFLGDGWIGFGNYLPALLLFLLSPILAVLPFADSYFVERKSGYLKNVCLRTHKLRYCAAKYLAVFLSGGTAVVVPMLLSLWMNSLLLPAIMPQASSAASPVLNTHMWGALFYSRPFAYLFCYLLLDFVFYGLIAAISLVVAFWAENRFVVVLTPFLLHVALMYICRWLGVPEYAPFDFLIPAGTPLHFIEILAAGLLLLVLTAGLFLGQGTKREVY